MKKLLYFILGTILWSTPELLLAATMPPDSISNETLILENTYWHQSTPYTSGERITLWKGIKSSDHSSEYIPIMNRKITGSLQAISKDSIQVGEEWVSVDQIVHITVPGKGRKEHVGIRKILPFIGGCLITIIFLIGSAFATYTGVMLSGSPPPPTQNQVTFSKVLRVLSFILGFLTIGLLFRRVGVRIGKRWRLNIG